MAQQTLEGEQERLLKRSGLLPHHPPQSRASAPHFCYELLPMSKGQLLESSDDLQTELSWAILGAILSAGMFRRLMKDFVTCIIH